MDHQILFTLVIFISLLGFIDATILSSNILSPRRSTISYSQLVIPMSEETCYGTIFDAGSSGTRVFIYNWPCRQIQTISMINITSQTPDKRTQPGLDQFANNINGIKVYLEPLIEFAKSNIPEHLWGFTPILLGATAGMRMLNAHDQDAIIQEVRNIFSETGLLFMEDNWARVITGQEEGSYMWLSINYLLQLLDPSISPNKTSLTIDLGGASTQIAFKPQYNPINTTLNTDLIIPNFNQYDIYSISYLNYGNDVARNEMIAQDAQEGSSIIQSPCFHNGYQMVWNVDDTKQVQGTGEYLKCLDMIKAYLNNDDKECEYPDKQCGINHNFQPNIDPSTSIYAISAVQNIASFYNLESFTLQQLQENSEQFCSLTWDEVQAIPEYKSNKYAFSNYFLSLYVYELLKTGYRISETHQIYSPSQISNNNPSWTLAGVFYQISQVECQYDSPICTTNQLPDIFTFFYVEDRQRE